VSKAFAFRHAHYHQITQAYYETLLFIRQIYTEDVVWEQMCVLRDLLWFRLIEGNISGNHGWNCSTSRVISLEFLSKCLAVAAVMASSLTGVRTASRPLPFIMFCNNLCACLEKSLRVCNETRD
jgi:hypothetical protein